MKKSKESSKQLVLKKKKRKSWSKK